MGFRYLYPIMASDLFLLLKFETGFKYPFLLSFYMNIGS